MVRNKRDTKYGAKIPSQRKVQADPWQLLETTVRTLAELKFGGAARGEYIAGVKCDCVIHLPGETIVVEISKQRTVTKLREDIAKFNSIRPHLIGLGIFPRCIFVTIDDPTSALIDAGQANHVTVYSVSQFFNSLLGLGNYATLRSKAAFGSAIDLYSGEPDESTYVPVTYYADDGEVYDTHKISERLISGCSVVLIGEYGAGKSRCVKEVYTDLQGNFKHHYKNPIAINLRENWGLKRASEMITRHFTELGLAERVSDILKVGFSKATIYLLDGFDEIGAQTWSDDPTKLLEIRKQSLIGVKDLIQRSSGGILITGREHYFNDDAELITCLGLASKNVLFLRCNQELSDKQFSELIGWEVESLPAWLPRKPLIGTVMRQIEQATMPSLLETKSGQADFWDLLMTTFCEREARINPALDGEIIRKLYTHLGRVARTTRDALGPLSIKSINDAFEATTGRPPTDESAIILQRLPGLGRIGAESQDRQFVDAYILDGLKAEDVLTIYSDASVDQLSVEWKHPVESFGAFYLSSKLADAHQINAVVAYTKRHRDSANKVFLSDLIAAVYHYGDAPVDFAGLNLSEGKFHYLPCSDSTVSGITFIECSFEGLDLQDSTMQRTEFRDCTIRQLDGYASQALLPPFFKNCAIQHFQNISTLVAIKGAGLSVAQTFLLSSLRKLFLQPGAGRQESSMYKGYRDAASKKVCERVINLLIREKFCQVHKGANGSLFIPDRSKTGRVKEVMNQMTNSKDKLWEQVTELQ